MFRPGVPFIKIHPKLMGVVEPLGWLPEKLNWWGFRDPPTGLGEEHRGALRHSDGDPHSLSHRSNWLSEWRIAVNVSLVRGLYREQWGGENSE